MAIINYIPNVKTPTGFDTLNTVSQFTNHVATGVFTNVDTYEINVPAPNDILTGQFVVIFVPDTDSIVGMKISINNGTAIPIDGVGAGSLQTGVVTSLLVDVGAGVAYQYFKDVDLTANNLPLTTGTAELYGVENVDDAFKQLPIISSYIAFCGATNIDTLLSAMGKGNEENVLFLGKQFAMYAWYKGASKVTSPFTNLITCSTINDIANNALALSEFRANTDLVALAETSGWGAYKLLNKIPLYSYGTISPTAGDIAVVQTVSGTMVCTKNSDNFVVSGAASGSYGAVGTTNLINVTDNTKLYILAKATVNAQCKIGYKAGALMSYDGATTTTSVDAINVKLYTFDISSQTTIGVGIGLSNPNTGTVYAMWVY